MRPLIQRRNFNCNANANSNSNDDDDDSENDIRNHNEPMTTLM